AGGLEREGDGLFEGEALARVSSALERRTRRVGGPSGVEPAVGRPLTEEGSLLLGLDRAPEPTGKLVVSAGAGGDRERSEREGRRDPVADLAAELERLPGVALGLAGAAELAREVGQVVQLDRDGPRPTAEVADDLEARCPRRVELVAVRADRRPTRGARAARPHRARRRPHRRGRPHDTALGARGGEAALQRTPHDGA